MDEAAPTVVAVVVTRNRGRVPRAGARRASATRTIRRCSVLVVDAGSADDPTARVAAALPDAFVHRARTRRRLRRRPTRRCASCEGATFLLVLPRRRRPRPRRGAAHGRGGLPLQRRDRRAQARHRDDPEVLLDVGRTSTASAARTPASSRASSTRSSTTPCGTSSTSRARRCSCAPTSSTRSAASTPTAFPGRGPRPVLAGPAGRRPCRRRPRRPRRPRRGRDPAAAPRTSRRPATLARRRVRAVLTCYSLLGRCCGLVPRRAAIATWRRRVRGDAPRRQAAGRCSARAAVEPPAPRAAPRCPSARPVASHASTTASCASCRSARPPASALFLSQHHADERFESLEDRFRDNLESFIHASTNPASLGLIVFLRARHHRLPRLLLLRRAGRRRLRRMARDPRPRRGLHIGVALHDARLDRAGPAAAGADDRARHGARRQRRPRPHRSSSCSRSPSVPCGALRLARHVGADAHRRGRRRARLRREPGAAQRDRRRAARPPRPVRARPRTSCCCSCAPPASTPAGAPGAASCSGSAIVTALASAWFPPGSRRPAARRGRVRRRRRSSPVGSAPRAAQRRRGRRSAVSARPSCSSRGRPPPSHGLQDPGRVRVHPPSQPLDPRPGPLRDRAGRRRDRGVRACSPPPRPRLFIASGPRLVWATRAWALTIVAWAAVELPARFAPGLAVPAPEGVLSLGALGLAIAAGLAVREPSPTPTRACAASPSSSPSPA